MFNDNTVIEHINRNPDLYIQCLNFEQVFELMIVAVVAVDLL